MFVGNNITNRAPANSPSDANTPYNGTANNNNLNFEYIDVDGDPSTFSSSTANLNISTSCKRIVYAGLYWTATYPFERSGPNGDGSSSNYTGSPRNNTWNQVKFKVPGGTYVDLIADNAADPVGDEDSIIFDGFNAANPNNSFYAAPYVCYKNVTSLVQALANANGTYAVANQRAARGIRPDGISSGWSLVVIYESPTLPSKYISVFDGYANIYDGINAANAVDFTVNGFQTLPSPLPVRARIGVSSLEGDVSLTNDRFRIKANSVATFSDISNAVNPANNFFNGSISNNGAIVTTRNPNSTNTLGFDLDIVNVNNPGGTVAPFIGGTVIPNGETGATLRVTTNGDAYGTYLATFDVEIIEPVISLTKVVQDIAGNNIGNAEVQLCQDLVYVIGFQNIGNDDAQNFTIRDVLPVNVTFDQLTTAGALPAGVTIQSYNPGTREVVFAINSSLVQIGDPRVEIRLRVKVVCSCIEMDDACSNLIQNQAYATYQGVLNNAQITDDPSLSAFLACNTADPSPSNFLVNLDNCNFTRTEILCGGSIVLTAANGYQSYTWSGPGTITPVAGTNGQSVTVTQPGTYTVNDIINTSPCKSIVETINVTTFGTGLTNPVIPYADQVVVCPNNGTQLPLIFLCGTGDSQLIQTNITGATGIDWYQLSGTCTPLPPANCPNENVSCTWNLLSSGPNFNATFAGQFKVIVRFPGGCDRTFYFNVYENILNPTYVTRDIICSTPGQITVNNVPAGYEYSLSPSGPWQTGNTFSIPTAGTYTVYIRQIGVTGGCVFTIPNIGIRARNFTATFTLTQPLCTGGKGSINISANDGEPQYTFTILQGATVVTSAGPIVPNNYVFNNLNPGNYTYQVTTQDGCIATGNFTINTPPALTVTAALTKPLTCTDGEITVYPVGGTPPFNYIVTGAVSGTQSSPVIVAPVAGTYNIQVVDFNNCSANTSIVVSNNPPPVFTVTSSNILCYGNNSGSITFNVTNANGYTLGYSITGAAPFFPTPNFTNLAPGNYTAIVQYTLGTSVCLSTPQAITITQPTQALTASGGVAAVACASNGGNGIVRITNVQGGTPYPAPNFYQYNFGSGYQNSNQANLPPGTYSISVRDANNCEYFMTVTLDPIPADPTINVGTPVFNCNGTATSTVTVNNGTSSYTYTYSINPPLVPPHNPTSNVFQNVPCGNSVVTVNYTLVSPPTFSNLLREDFGQGDDTTSPGINPAYCFERQINNASIYCKTGPEINDGDYSVTKKILFPFGAWYNFLDHTSNGTNPNGRFLAINIGGVAGVGGILYSKPIADIIPNQDIKVSLWAANLLKIDPSNTQSPPDLTIQLVKDLGLPSQTIIATSNTGNIPKSNAWINYQLTLNPGPNTNLSFVIRSNIAVTSGNDVVIDDIEVYQLPVACLTTRNFPINIPCNQAFSSQVTGHRDVSCAGANDATITIAAQNFNTTNGYQVSMNNGATWTTYFTSPVTVPVPATGYPGFVLVRYDSTPGNAACSFNLPQTIITPTVLVLSATASPATCVTGATITATAGGGTPAYQYQLTNSVGTVIVAYQSNNVFSNIAPGSYIVVVRDFNLCTTNFPITISSPPTLSATIASSSDFCYDTVNSATLVVNASGGTAPYLYNINGGPFGSSNTFGSLTPGNYTIIVRDSFGCTFTLPAQTINPQLTLSTNLTKDLDCTVSPNAVITGTVTGGYPGYTYTVNAGGSVPVPVSGIFTYSTATPGTYNFVVTDSRGCVTATSSVTIAPLSLPQITSVTQTQQILCNGDSTAAINVVINTSVGTAPYVINVRNTTTGINYGTQTTGLPVGSYLITLTDAKSCTDTETITITQPAPLNFTAVVNPMTCTAGGTALGSICVNGLTGGTAPYVYTLTDLTGGTGTQTFSTPLPVNHCFININFGIYNLSVTDANGCTLIRTNLIMSSPPNDLDIVISTSIASCAAGGTAVVSLPSGFGGPYLFGIVTQATAPYVTPPATLMAADPGFPLQHTFTGLTPGALYTFVVYDSTTGCYYFEQAAAPVPTNSTMVVNPLTANNVTCIGAADGSVTFTVTGIGAGATSVNYTIYNAQTNIPITPLPGPTGIIPAPFPSTTYGPLAPGNYYIQLTENGGVNGGCGIISSTFTISQSSTPLAVSATATNDNCNTNAGIITAVGTGGTAPYRYSFVLSPLGPGTWGVPGANTYNVESGTYNVYVQDANGCIRSTTVTVNLDPTPVISASLVNACVAQGTYQINVSLTSPGVGPYVLSLDGGAFVTHTLPYTFTNLSSGTHTVQVKDFNGCGNTVNVTILDPLVAGAAFTTQPTCNNPNGQISVTTTGGSGNYSYSISPNPGGTITLSTNVFSNVPPGSYTITVTDTTTSCTTTAPANLAAPVPVTFTTTTTPVVCIGDSNGTITVNLSAGNNNPAYTYEIIPGTGPQTANVFTGLAAGNYTVIVTSGRGCSTTTPNVIVGQPMTINVPAPSVTQFACNAGTNTNNLATITVTGVTGGSGTFNNYEFILGGTVMQSGPSNIYNTANTAGGTYSINVYDSNGCIGSTTAVVNPYISISNPVVTVINPITCTTLESISVSVTTTGGVPPVYNYTIDSIPAGFTQSNTTGIFNGLTVGDYMITVTNPITNCSVQIIHYVFDPNTFDLNASLITDVSCLGGSNGSVTLTFVDNQLNPTNDAGPFTYVVTNTTTSVSTAGSSPTAGPILISGLNAGLYTVSASLVNTPNCTATTNFTINQPTVALGLSIATTSITCLPGNDGTITALASGGWPGAYEYQLELGASIIQAYNANNLFTGLAPGNYTVSVRDSKGCIVSVIVPMTIPTPINTTVTPSTTLLACYGDTNASITIAYPTGGQGSNYSYVFNTISPVASSSGPIAMPLAGATISGLGAGTYNVTITDGFNCTFTSANIVINQPTEVNASLLLTNSPSCDNPTVLTLSANGGTPPYTYSSDGVTYSAATFNPSVAISIPAGTTGVYHYFVRDANGCVSVVSNDIQIDPIPAMTLSTLTHGNILCGGFATGTITAVAQGGLGNYVYSLVDAGGNPIAVGTQATPGVFTNLPAGTYYIHVVSTNAFGSCLYTSGPVIITEPTPFIVSSPYPQKPRCNGGSDGAIWFYVTGGTAPIQYAISPNLNQFQNIAIQMLPDPIDPINNPPLPGIIIPNLAFGTYNVVIQDANGCFHSFNNITVNEPAILSGIVTGIDRDCAEDPGMIQITNINGGTAPYTVTYVYTDPVTNTQVNGPVVNLATGDTDHDFTPLPTGVVNYNVIIYDANYSTTIPNSTVGCNYSFELNVDPGVKFTPYAVPTFPCDNNGAFPSVVVEVFNSDNTPSNTFVPLSDYVFALDSNNIADAQLSNIFTSANYPSLLTPNIPHTVHVWNANGCDHVTTSFTITPDQIDPLMWQGPGLVQGGLNEIVANVTGGTPPYTYDFNGHNNGNDNSYIYDATGPYTVTVTDAAGCFVTMTKPFRFYPIEIPDVFTPNGDGENDDWYPHFVDESNYPNLITKIYDRYGRVVAELNVNQKWNGKYHGNELPTGDYWYVLKVDGNDGQEFVGHFTLYR